MRLSGRQIAGAVIVLGAILALALYRLLSS